MKIKNEIYPKDLNGPENDTYSFWFRQTAVALVKTQWPKPSSGDVWETELLVEGKSHPKGTKYPFQMRKLRLLSISKANLRIRKSERRLKPINKINKVSLCGG